MAFAKSPINIFSLLFSNLSAKLTNGFCTSIVSNNGLVALLTSISVSCFADKLLKSKENILIGDFAKAIYTDGVNLGQNKLFSWLRDKEYLYKKNGDNFPYQKYIDNGLFI